MVKALALFKDKNFIKSIHQSNVLDDEDKEILRFLQEIRTKMIYAELCLDDTNEPLLIDSFIYEMKALEKRYDYYVKLSKEKNIIITNPNILTKFPAS